MPSPSPPLERLILVIGDSPDHVAQVTAVLGRKEYGHRVEAIAELTTPLAQLQAQSRQLGTVAPGLLPPPPSLPDLMLLDLTQPASITPAYEFLAALKGDPTLRRIPVIVLAFADQAEAILRAYTLQGNCYIVRPQPGDGLATVLERIQHFWLTIATLPSL